MGTDKVLVAHAIALIRRSVSSRAARGVASPPEPTNNQLAGQL
jgi:hypothetical protein